MSFKCVTVSATEFETFKQRIQEYVAAVARSKGFDVPHFPDPCLVSGVICPVMDLDAHKDELDLYGGLAVEHYNRLNGTHFDIVRIVRVNVQVFGPQHSIYYITFQARSPPNYLTQTFRAQLRVRVPQGTDVSFCTQVRPQFP